jgi:hypothetical protein
LGAGVATAVDTFNKPAKKETKTYFRFIWLIL